MKNLKNKLKTKPMRNKKNQSNKMINNRYIS